MNIACYIRVSTSEQTAENQLPAIKDFCKARWWPEPEVYQENESAWRAGHQHELARLLRELRTGKRKIDFLVVWSLDRLSRQGIAATLQLINSFEVVGCKIVSLHESWISEEGPMREVFAAMAAWAAKYESDKKSENTKAGLARAVSQGKRLGRPMGSKDSRKRRSVGYLLRYASPELKERYANNR